MKKLVIILLSLFLVFSLVGCGGKNANAGTSSAENETAGGSTDADRDHTLIWAVSATPNGMDHEIHYSMSAMEAETNVYDSLLNYEMVKDPSGSGFIVPDFNKIVGDLAESWEWSADNKTITVHLKKGVISHDGNEMTADDWMYKQERGWALDQGIKNFGGWNMGLYDLSQIQKIDDYTFSITFNTEVPIAEQMIAHLAEHMLDSKKFQEVATDDDPWCSTWMATNSAGYGPYKMVEFTPGNQVVFERHEQYWDNPENIYFDKVIMKEVPQSSNRVAMLLSGDIDAATYLSSSELEKLNGQEGVSVYHYTGNLMTSVQFNHHNEILSNRLVRQALSWAVPYEEIQSTVYMGTANQQKSVIPSIYPGYTDQYFQYTTDYETAKSLLAEAGYPDGFEMTITVNTGTPQHEQIAILLQTAFKNIGVNLVIEKMPNGDFYNKVAQHSFDGMYVFEDSPGTPDGGFAIGLWASYPSTQNVGEYNNERVNELYQLMASTRDQEARLKAMDEVQKIVVQEDPCWLFIAEPGYHMAVRDDIEGLQWNTLQQIGWKYLYRTEG